MKSWDVFHQRYPKCLDRKADVWEARVDWAGTVQAENASAAISEARRQRLSRAPMVRVAAQ